MAGPDHSRFGRYGRGSIAGWGPVWSAISRERAAPTLCNSHRSDHVMNATGDKMLALNRGAALVRFPSVRRTRSFFRRPRTTLRELHDDPLPSIFVRRALWLQSRRAIRAYEQASRFDPNCAIALGTPSLTAPTSRPMDRQRSRRLDRAPESHRAATHRTITRRFHRRARARYAARAPIGAPRWTGYSQARTLSPIASRGHERHAGADAIMT